MFAIIKTGFSFFNNGV